MRGGVEPRQEFRVGFGRDAHQCPIQQGFLGRAARGVEDEVGPVLANAPRGLVDQAALAGLKPPRPEISDVRGSWPGRRIGTENRHNPGCESLEFGKSHYFTAY